MELLSVNRDHSDVFYQAKVCVYQRKNILFAEISRAGYYPWFENPEEVPLAFQRFCQFFNIIA